jgi:hypothetical protein
MVAFLKAGVVVVAVDMVAARRGLVRLNLNFEIEEVFSVEVVSGRTEVLE